MSGMELVHRSRSIRRSDGDDGESDTDFSAISSLTSEHHPLSASLAQPSRPSLLVSI